MFRKSSDEKFIEKVIKKGKEDIIFFATVLLNRRPTPGISGRSYEINGRRYPYMGQAGWLRFANRKINCLATSNRWGKSTVSAIKHLWHGFYKIGWEGTIKEFATKTYYTLNCGPETDLTNPVFKEISDIRQDPECLIADSFQEVRIDKYFKGFRFDNSAEVHFRTTAKKAKGIHGKPYHYISFDECDRENYLDEIVTEVLLPRTLDTGGRIDLISTPAGVLQFKDYFDRGFLEEYKKDFYSQAGIIEENSTEYGGYLLPKDIEEIRRTILASNPRILDQVMKGSFIEAPDAVFHHDTISKFFDKELPEAQPGKQDRQYVAGWDLGITADPTVGFVLDVTEKPYKTVRYEYLLDEKPEIIYQRIREVHSQYGIKPSMTIIDAAGMGGQMFLKELSSDVRPTEWVTGRRKGMDKIGLVTALIRGMDNEEIKCFPIPKFRDELYRYRWKDDRLRCDHLMSMAMAYWQTRRHEAYKKMNVVDFNPLSIPGRRSYGH